MLLPLESEARALRKATKTHVCNCCNSVIHRGELYHFICEQISDFSDKVPTFYNFKICALCYINIKYYFQHHEACEHFRDDLEEYKTYLLRKHKIIPQEVQEF